MNGSKSVADRLFLLNKIDKILFNSEWSQERFFIDIDNKKLLKQKFGFNEYTILKNFSRPSLKIKHGKIKNFQFHLKSCHLDLFFLNEDETYKFRHYDIRASSIFSSLNKDKCVKELNSNFTLIHDLK